MKETLEMPRKAKPPRKLVTVKVDADIHEMGKLISDVEGIDLVDLLSQELRPHLKLRLEKAIREAQRKHLKPKPD